MDRSPTKRRTKHRSGVVKLSVFFCDNPDEELTAEDAAMKLGISPRSAANYLSMLCSEGGLERVSVYRVKKPTNSTTA